MLKLSKQALGKATQSRTALILFAAAAFTGGTASEASAHSYRHYHHYQHVAYRHHQHVAHRHYQHYAHYAHPVRHEAASWRDANASISPTAGTGHSFTGVASFYGNESGHQTASSQTMSRLAPRARCSAGR